MATISKTKTWVDNDKVNYTDINGNFDTIYNEFNGNIDNSNIKSGAAIDPTKISGTALTLQGVQISTGKKTFQATVATITADTDAATITFDLAASNIHTVTLGGNRTLALANVSVGQVFALRLVQDATGSRTVTWFPTIKWPFGVVPTLTVTPSKTDVFSFICTGSGTYDGFTAGQSL